MCCQVEHDYDCQLMIRYHPILSLNALCVRMSPQIDDGNGYRFLKPVAEDLLAHIDAELGDKAALFVCERLTTDRLICAVKG